MNLKYVCRICNYECTSKNIGQHLRYSHKDLNITAKNYYDTYLKKSTDGICKICSNPTSFKCISEGYKLTCSKKCGDILSAKKTSIALKNKSVEDKRAIREKIEKTNIERYGVKCIFDTFTSEEKHEYAILGTNKQKELAKNDPLYYYHADAIEKQKQTNLIKYGYTSNFSNPELIKEYVEIKRNKNDGQYFSNTARKSISEHRLEYLKTHTFIKSRYFYNNEYFDSSWELAYYIWLQNNNINFEYHNGFSFTYYINGKKHLYFPDFKIDNQYIEIKGTHLLESETYKIPDEKLKCMHDNNIKIIGKYEIKQYLKYCKDNGINLIAYKCKD